MSQLYTRLSGGAFTRCRWTPGSPGPSSQPVAAAGQGGLVLVAFVNSGTLYVVGAARPPRP